MIPYENSKLSWVMILPPPGFSKKDFLNEISPSIFKSIRDKVQEEDCLIKVPYVNFAINLDLKESINELYNASENFSKPSLKVLTQANQPVSGDVEFTQTGSVEHGPKGVKAKVKTELVMTESCCMQEEEKKDLWKSHLTAPIIHSYWIWIILLRS